MSIFCRDLNVLKETSEIADIDDILKRVPM